MAATPPSPCMGAAALRPSTAHPPPRPLYGRSGAAPLRSDAAPLRSGALRPFAAVLRPSAAALRPFRQLWSHDLTTEGINVCAEERRTGQFRVVRPAPDAHALRAETNGDGLPRSAGGRLDVHIV